MNCRTAQQLITDAVTDELSAPQHAALALHCDQCASCRAEWEALRALWERMGRSRVPEPAADLPERFAQRVAGTKSSVARPQWWSSAVAAALAMLLLGGFGGFAVARWTMDAEPLSMPNSTLPAYLLLLYGETEAPGLTNTQLIAEYVQWAAELRAEGRLIEAHRLLERVSTVVPTETGPAVGAITPVGDDAVSGFFLIRADDMDRALEVALEGPHARYGGRIDVRPIAQ